MQTKESTPLTPPAWTFGDRVRKARRIAHLSQEGLAQEVGKQLRRSIAASTIASWETDSNQPGYLYPVTEALSAVTGIPADWFNPDPESSFRFFPEGDTSLAA